jgi:hypothetical protein
VNKIEKPGTDGHRLAQVCDLCLALKKQKSGKYEGHFYYQAQLQGASQKVF